MTLIRFVLTHRSGKIVTASFESETKIAQVKQTLAKMIQEFPSCIVLFHMGQLLSDERKTLSDYDVDDEDEIVHVVMAMTQQLSSKLEADEKRAVELCSEAGRGNLNRVNQLLAEGTNPDFHLKRHGSTALQTATWNGHHQVVERLLQAGASLSSTDKFGKNSLHYACQYGKDKVIQLLIKQGADINATTKDGRTPLMYAARDGGFFPCVLLMKAGANIALKGADGKTAIDLAKSEDIKKALNDALERQRKAAASN